MFVLIYLFIVFCLSVFLSSLISFFLSVCLSIFLLKYAQPSLFAYFCLSACLSVSFFLSVCFFMSFCPCFFMFSVIGLFVLLSFCLFCSCFVLFSCVLLCVVKGLPRCDPLLCWHNPCGSEVKKQLDWF